MRALVAAILACLACAATAGAAAPWSPPVDLSVTGGDADDLRVDVNGGGTTLPVWTRSTASAGVIQAAPRAPGGSFAAPVDLTPLDGDANEPHVALDAAGNAIAVWVLFDGVNSIVQAATRTAGGSFGPAVDVSRDGEDGAEPHVALSPSGDAVVTWINSDGGEQTVQAAVRPAGGDFGAPVVLAEGGAPTTPEVAMAADGTAIAVWIRIVGSDNLAEAAVRPAGGGFPATPAPIPLSDPGGDADCPQLAIDPAGNATVAWCRTAGGGDGEIEAATRPAGGSFARADVVSDGGGDAAEPDVAVDAGGDVTVAWDLWDGVRYVVQAATRPSGGAFGRPVDLNPAGDAAFAQVAASPAGDTVVAWEGDAGSHTRAEAAYRPAGGSFGEPVELSAGGHDARNVRVAIDGEGSPLAAWERFDGSDWIAQASALDVAGPQLTGVSVPASAVAGAPVPVSVSAFDVWSPFSVAWSFGDGGGATGPTASHAYAAPGTYTVTVTATDAGGRSTGAARQIVVSPGPAPDPNPPAPPPKLSGPTLTPAAFRAAARGGRGGARPAGTRVGFRLDRAATVRFAVQRQAAGRRVGGRCVAATRRNRRASACSRWIAVRGSFARDGAAGRNGFAFSGRVGGRKLAPGRYRLLATPTAAGLTGATASTPFRILRPAPARSRTRRTPG